MNKKGEQKSQFDIDQEIIDKGKSALGDFDGDKEFVVFAKQRENKLISIRLPTWMLNQLREVANARGVMGYQQLIKEFISEGLKNVEGTDKSRNTVFLLSVCSSGSKSPGVFHADELQTGGSITWPLKVVGR